MPSPTSRFRSGFFLVLTSLLMAPAIAHSAGPVFLGTNPVAIGKVPVPMANISGIGVDADGNQYYADAVAGRVIEVTPSGTSTTIASSLSQPLIAVDFLGDVFVADTGTGRLLKIAAWPTRTTTVLASVSKQHAIALDNGNNLFLLSGDQLVEIPDNGVPAVMATIPGAALLGFGPGSPGTAHLYILSVQNGAYSAQLYSYSTSGISAGTLSAPLRNFLPDLGSAVLEGFLVDPQGNPIVEANIAGHGKVVISSTSGYKHALYTAGIPTVPIAQDALGSLYYVDGPSLIQIQLGTVNFGVLDQAGYFGFYPPQFTLNFGATPNVTWVLSQEPAGPFVEGDIQSGSGPLVDQAQLYLYFWPVFFLGYASGTLNLTDQNNVTTLSIPLVATATDGGYSSYYLPAPDLRAHPIFQPAAQTAAQTVTSRCPCGTFALNSKTGSVTHNGNEIVSGLQNVRGADVDAQGNLYVTQRGVAGTLRVAADGSTSRIATDIADPIGSAMDGLGNLYVLNGDDIVRVAPDDSEAVFATPVTNGGYTSLLSVATDLFNNVYAGYGTSPNATHGAILKFSPAGAHSLVPTDTKQPTGLAVYPCGALFFADAERGTVAVVPGYKLEKVIGFGLTDPTNLQCAEGGTISGQDPGIAGGQFVVAPTNSVYVYSYDFGKVVVGSSRSITLSAVGVGSSAFAKGPASAGAIFCITVCGGGPFLPNQSIFTGALTEITLGFMPTAVGTFGPYPVTILDQSDEDALSNYETINLSGTGVNPP